MSPLKPSRKNKKHEFTLILSGPDVLTEKSMEALFDAGCSDGTFGEVDGRQSADFTRSAESLAAAVCSAIQSVESAIPGLTVRRVEPDDLVAAADIARRANRSRESIRLLIAGSRGPGGFPFPVAKVRTTRPLWRWTSVVSWFATALGENFGTESDAIFIAALNSALEFRSLAPQIVEPRQRRELRRLLGQS